MEENDAVQEIAGTMEIQTSKQSTKARSLKKDKKLLSEKEASKKRRERMLKSPQTKALISSVQNEIVETFRDKETLADNARMDKIISKGNEFSSLHLNRIWTFNNSI